MFGATDPTLFDAEVPREARIELIERQEYCHIWHTIRGQYHAHAQQIIMFTPDDSPEREAGLKKLQWDLINKFKPQIARLGELFRKYELFKFYPDVTKNTK